MTNYRSARACAVKPLRLVAQPLRALGLDRAGAAKQRGLSRHECRNLLEGTSFWKESKEGRSPLLATAKALDKRDLI
jgi:hypothetical protein